jgi:hypothetical protein
MNPGGDSDDDDDDDGHEGDSIESISPRVLFPAVVEGGEVEVRRRLDFSSLSLSPIVPRSSPPRPPQLFTERILVCDDDCSSACCSVGECGVCYTNLPLRANHIFTMCGHLFCVRCVFKWWDTATTCPICRAELFQHEADPVVEVAAPAPAPEEEAEAEAEAAPAAAAERNDNDGVLLGRERNNRYGGLISSDSESDTAGVEAPEEEAVAEEEEAEEEAVAEDAVLRLWDSERVSSYVRNIARAIRREHWYNNYNGGTVSSDSESDSAIDFT